MFAERFSVSRETLVKLETYEALLRSWQKTINLVSPRSLDEIWHRHFADSAQLVSLVSEVSDQRSDTFAAALRWIDLGSGAGFPGMVVAIMLGPRARVTLIESDQRKCAFLREVARQTGTPVEILSIRIESAATQFRVHQPDVVSARALAPLQKLLQLSAPLFAPRTVGLFLKGREAAREVEEASRHWQFAYALQPSLTDPEARVVVIRDLRV